MKRRILSVILCVALLLSLSAPTLATDGAAGEAAPAQDASGTYLIGTADELYWFAEKVKAQAEADAAAGEKFQSGYLKRTRMDARLTADIHLNPDITFAYDHETGLIAVTNGGKTLYMGTGMQKTYIGSFHPLYNGICTQEEWDAKEATDSERAELQAGYLAEAAEKVAELGLRPWTPIGTAALPFVGNFDGDGHTVDGVYINDESIYCVGLFGYTSTYLHTGYYDRTAGEIKNLTLGKNSLVVGHHAEFRNGIEPSNGGIVGKISFDKITDCTNYALVVGTGSYADSTGGTGHTGGVVGTLFGNASGCVNYGTVISAKSAGGVIGTALSSSTVGETRVERCANYGNIYTDTADLYSRAGGIAVSSGSDLYGGSGSTVTGCTNYGYVEGARAGGILARAGDDANTRYCANFGTVAGMSAAAGLVEYITREGFYLNGCYNAGKVELLPFPAEWLTETGEFPYGAYRAAFPLVSRIYVRNGTSHHDIQNCYNDETVCPTADGALVGLDIVNVTDCYSVPTAFFATGEPAYKMGAYRTGSWRQDLPLPAEDGKTPETYPRVDGTRRVFENKHFCCHTDEATKEAHKTLFYANTEGNTVDTHTLVGGICTHCGADLRTPVLSPATLPEAKEREDYRVTIRAPETPGAVTYELVTSETDDTPYVLPNWLSWYAGSSSENSYLSIYGEPSLGTAGTYTFTVKATNQNGTTKQNYTLVIEENPLPPFAITTEFLPYGVVGAEYYAELCTTSDGFGVRWSVMKDTPLPDGLRHDGYSEIYGIPTAAGEYKLRLEAVYEQDKKPEYAYADFTLTVYETDPQKVPESAERQPEGTANVRIEDNDRLQNITGVVDAVDIGDAADTLYVNYALQVAEGYDVETVYDISLWQTEGESSSPFSLTDYGATAVITLRVGTANAQNLADGKLVLIHLPKGGGRVVYGVDKAYDPHILTVDVAAGTVTFKTDSCSPFLLARVAEKPGVTVSGKVTSYNPSLAAAVTLMQGGEVKYTATVSAATGSGKVTEDFRFEAVAAGTYDLVVKKDAHLTYTVKNVVVGDTPLDLTADTGKPYAAITLLAGDLDGDSSITEDDVAVIRLPENMNRLASAAKIGAADIDGDGSVTEDDVSILRYTVHMNKNTGDCTYDY